jgi:Tfp pilus assembly protein PilF
MKKWVRLLMIAGMLSGCASHKAPPTTILAAPSGTSAKAATFMVEGDRLFQAKDWAGASQSYQAAVGVQPDLAEAHYNVAVTLDRLGKKDEAKKHYVAAANLAPGHKVIWDSPPFRDAPGLNHNIREKSYLDPTPGTRF